MGEEDRVADRRAGRQHKRCRRVPPAGAVLHHDGLRDGCLREPVRARANTSAPPPGAKPTTNVIGRVGKSPRGACATAGVATITAVANAVKNTRVT